MRLISRTSARLKFIVCASQLEAQLLENDLIQRLKPRFNIAGAFSHRYPFIGLMAQNINQQEFVDVSFVITREPEKYPGFQFHGVYRSWSLTVKAFESFMNLFSMIAIVKNKPKLEQAYRDQRWKFSRVSADYVEILNRLLSGEDSDISRLVLDLADSAQARKKMRQTQGHLNWIKYFMKHEISVLKKMRKVCSEVGYPISQVARDQLRLRSVLE